MVIWTVLGCALLIAVAVVTARLQGASLGPYSTRLLAIGATIVGYYGLTAWLHPVAGWFAPVRLRWLHYAVPVLAAAAALYCLWRVVQNYQSELHGLLKGALKLTLVLALAAMARLCLSR